MTAASSAFSGSHQAALEPADPAAQLRREFTLWSSFAFAFAFISPIVALYGIYALALTAAGPGFVWNFLIVFVGQLFVALVFAELVSRWPIEGSVYQWAGRLLGRPAGWFAGWTYLWTLMVAMAVVALSAGGFLCNVIGIGEPSNAQKVGLSFVILALGTAANLIGRRVLRIFMTASIVAEVVGSVGLGTWLLLFHRRHGLGFLFQGTGASTGWHYLSGPFLLTMAFVGFSFVGFESAGSIAEEVQEPRRHLPKAVLFSLTCVAAVVTYSAVAVTLAVPDLGAVVSGSDTDPVTTTLTTALGSRITRPLELLFVIGFTASFLALQTSASRILWSYARDRALPFSGGLGRLSTTERIPVWGVGVTFVVGSVVFLLSIVQTDLYSVLVNFVSGGFFLAFLFPLVGAVLARATGRWSPGPWQLGRAGAVVAVVATLWAAFQFLNISWPRQAYPHWYLNWSFYLVAAVLGVVGLALYRSRAANITLYEIPDDETPDPAAAAPAPRAVAGSAPQRDGAR